MAEDEGLPAWLIELRDEQLRKQQQPTTEDQQEAAWSSDLQAQQPMEPPWDSGEGWGQVSRARAEDQQAPAWFTSPREPVPEEQPREAEEEQGPPEQKDVMASLREQMLEGEEEYGREQKPSPTKFLRDLAPGKRLVLAVLLFLDVALCGCMALVMAGRVMPPF